MQLQLVPGLRKKHRRPATRWALAHDRLWLSLSFTSDIQLPELFTPEVDKNIKTQYTKIAYLLPFVK